MLSPAQTIRTLSGSSGHKATMPLLSIILLSIMAGGAIAMGDIFWAHSTVGVASSIAPGIANVIGGFAFSVGLILVVLFGGHLFTGSVLSGVTTFEKKLSLPRMTYYWALVWLFNFVGSVLIAWLYYRSGLPLKYDESILKLFVSLGVGKTHLTFEQAFIRGIFCNVFVCMGVWAATAAKDTAGKVLAIAIIITAFIACGYEHCVANMFIITEALLAKAHYLAQAGGDLQAMSALVNNIPIEKIGHLGVKSFLIDNLLPVTLGNIVGGLAFVGLTGLISHKKDME